MPSKIYLMSIHGSNITWTHTIGSNTTNFIWLDIRVLPIFLYVCPILGIVGLFLNVLVFIVLSDAEFKETLYKYLKIEAMFIGTNLFVTCFRPVHYKKEDWYSKSYFSYFYLVYGLHFLASILEMAAILAQLCSTLDFYLLISNYHKRFKLFRVVKYYKTMGLAIFLFSVLLYLYQIFDKKITCYMVQYENSLRRLCRDEPTEFSETLAKKSLEMGVFILRDFVFLLLLMALNVLIFFQVKRSMKNKKSVLKYVIHNRKEEKVAIKYDSSTQETLKSIERTQQRATLMVFFNGLNYFFGRTPILIYFVWYNLEDWSDSLLLCLQIAVLAVYLSYTLKFFLYCYSNNKFKRSFKNKA
jgi:hypothetical protein